MGKSSLANVVPILLHVFDAKTQPSQATARITARQNAHTTDDFSTIWRRLLDQIAWNEDVPSIGFKPTQGKRRITLREAFGLGDNLVISDVRGILEQLPGSVFIIDEFDRIATEHVKNFTDLVKDLADSAVDSTVVFVGVAETIGSLIQDHASVSRSLMQIHLRRMSKEELQVILKNAEDKLQVKFSQLASEFIVMMSQGLPHWTHLIGLNAVKLASERLSRVIEKNDIDGAMGMAIRSSDQTVRDAYDKAIHSSQKAARYQQVLLACAIAAANESDASGYFQPAALAGPLRVILRRKSVEIATFNRHLVEFCGIKRSVLERDGASRSFRYRFRNPLMRSYVLVRGVAENLISQDELAEFMRGSVLK